MTLAYLANLIFNKSGILSIYMWMSQTLSNPLKSCEKMGHKMIKNLKTFKIYAVKISEYIRVLYIISPSCPQAVLKPYNYYWQNPLTLFDMGFFFEPSVMGGGGA